MTPLQASYYMIDYIEIYILEIVNGFLFKPECMHVCLKLEFLNYETV